ncbi:hypothetical protein AB1L10_20705 [Peribacillus frigoritolerans]
MNFSRFYLSNRRLLVNFSHLLVSFTLLLVSLADLLVNLTLLLVSFTLSPEAPLDRPGQPADHAGAYVLTASDEGANITGQCIHINGGSRCPHNSKTTEKHGAFRSFPL